MFYSLNLWDIPTAFCFDRVFNSFIMAMATHSRLFHNTNLFKNGLYHLLITWTIRLYLFESWKWNTNLMPKFAQSAVTGKFLLFWCYLKLEFLLLFFSFSYFTRWCVLIFSFLFLIPNQLKRFYICLNRKLTSCFV